MPYADVNPELDTVAAISGMADVLDQAAEAVSTGISSENVTATEIGEGDAISLGSGPSQIEGTINQGGGSPSPAIDATMGGGPSEDTMPQSIYGTPGGESPDIANLGDRPSLGQLQSAIESGGLPTEGGPTMGGGPSDLMNLMGEEEAVEEVAPGEEVANFLSDFDRSMSAENPVQGLVAKIDSLQNQAAQLQTQAAGGAYTMGGGPQEIGNVATDTVEAQGVRGGWGGNAGWNDPNTVSGQLGMLSARMDRMERLSDGLQAVQKGYPQPSLDIDNYVGDTVASEAEAANLNAINIGDPAALSAAGIAPVESMVTETSLPATPAGTTDEFFGGQWFTEEGATPTRQETLIAEGKLPDLRFLPDKFEDITQEQMALMEKTVNDWIAPKYSGKMTGYQTHDQMYPDHRNKAAMAGVASIKSMFDGTHKAWIEAINEDMEKRGIKLDHEIDGVKTGKHSSGNWIEYDAIFTVGEDGVPRDSKGVAMPGTEEQAQVGISGVLQGLWGGILSGAGKFFKPSTSSGVGLNAPVNTSQTAITSGGEDSPVDIIRSSYAWASSLPNNVLSNAARYPDYLRLLIENDAAGKDLPLTVPTWILEGTDRPAEDEEETVTWISNHPAMQTQELFVGS